MYEARATLRERFIAELSMVIGAFTMTWGIIAASFETSAHRLGFAANGYRVDGISSRVVAFR
jgi:hypothetical protein